MGNKNLFTHQYRKIIMIIFSVLPELLTRSTAKKYYKQMENRLKNNFKITLALGFLAILTLSCERDLTDEALEATFSNNPLVFIDGFSAGLEYLPFAGSRPDAFSVDTNEKFEGTASMRFDVPNVGDPLGAFAGAIFPDFGGRDLTEYDALTFWAKATTAGTINEIGFGQDFGENKFLTSLQNLQLTTNWQKYTIPLPDPSKLTQEKGLFWYAEGPEDGNGYTFWIDEIKYEKLGTIAQPQPKIFNGEDQFQQSFNGASTTVSGLTQTFNLGNGINQTVAAAPAYFEFTSSNLGVATVSETGEINIIGAGTTVITATLGDVPATGSLTLESLGEFELAPIPTRNPENVISIFSNQYNNVPVDFFNGYWEPFQTTLSADFNVNGDDILNYYNFNFVGIQFSNPTVDATTYPNLHLNMYIPGEVPSNLDLLITIRDFGADQQDGGGDDTFQQVFFNSSHFESNTWSTLEIPLTLTNKNHLGLIILENVNASTLESFYLDNIYFYNDVIEPSPNVDDSGASQVALPIGFESTTLTYDFLGFEGADSAIIDNPDPSGINPTSKVMRTTKTAGAQFFAGTLLNLDAPIDFSSSQKLRMKVWSPKSGIPVRVRLENADNSVGIELDANTTTINEWEELEWDFSNSNTNADFVRIVVFFEFVPDLPGDGSSYYYDDIQIIE